MLNYNVKVELLVFSKYFDKEETIALYLSQATFVYLQVCAPTGAGKTNIAMIAVLHEVSIK